MTDKLVGILKDKGLTIAAAESCTGGAFMHSLVKVPGVSAVLRGGVVAYSEHSKEKLLCVNAKTIKQYSVVSTQVAAEMAAGVREKFGADIGVGITGYAGPGGERVGEVCFGIDYKGLVFTAMRRFKEKSRGEVIDACVAFLVDWLYEKV